MPPFTPSPERIEKLNEEWIEPWYEESKPSNLTFNLYETRSSGRRTQGSYWYNVEGRGSGVYEGHFTAE
jgi:hypothetical protein